MYCTGDQRRCVRRACWFAGRLGELYGWHYGFGVAGIGMLVGIAIYMSGRVHLPPDRITSKGAAPVQLQPGDALGHRGAGRCHRHRGAVSGSARRRSGIRIRCICGIMSIETCSASTSRSRGSNRSTPWRCWHWRPVVIWYWRRQSKRGVEPKDLTKIAAGCCGVRDRLCTAERWRDAQRRRSGFNSSGRWRFISFAPSAICTRGPSRSHLFREPRRRP